MSPPNPSKLTPQATGILDISGNAQAWEPVSKSRSLLVSRAIRPASEFGGSLEAKCWTLNRLQSARAMRTSQTNLPSEWTIGAVKALIDLGCLTNSRNILRESYPALSIHTGASICSMSAPIDRLRRFWAVSTNSVTDTFGGAGNWSYHQ